MNEADSMTSVMAADPTWTLREDAPTEPGEGHEWHLDQHGDFEWHSAVVVYGMEGPDRHDAEGYARALSILAFLNGESA